MCGIVGYISGAGKGGYPSDRYRFIKQGLVVDSLRGMDATGLFTIDVGEEKEPAYWVKNAIPGGKFVCTKEFAEALSSPPTLRAVIGHNRAATVGLLDTDSAHPFQVGPITLVHNGTLSSTHGMPLTGWQLKNKKDVQVDSHVIAHNLAHEPIDQWYETLTGSWALVWHDARDGSVNVVRNGQRPLHMAKLRNEDTIVLCSEANMLAYLADRSTMLIHDVFQFAEHHHFKWLPDSPTMEPVVTKMPYTPARFYSSNWGMDGYDIYDDDPAWGGRRSAPSSVPFSDRLNPSTLILCGREQEVPPIHQEKLLELDLVTEDRLLFQPWFILNPGHKSGLKAVSGWLRTEERPAIVYGVPSGLCSSVPSGKTEEWLVWPIGVTVPDKAPEGPPSHSGPVALCKFIRIKPPVAAATRSYDARDVTMVVGPGQFYIPINRYMELVRDGCVLCKRTLGLMDDADILWDDEDRPLCVVCQTDSQDRKVN